MIHQVKFLLPSSHATTTATIDQTQPITRSCTSTTYLNKIFQKKIKETQAKEQERRETKTLLPVPLQKKHGYVKVKEESKLHRSPRHSVRIIGIRLKLIKIVI